jgi:REP element-mobilizing transposase RayT
MSDTNPNFHQRRSIRLKGYDYSKAGLYFITMCVQNRDCLFGEIPILNDAGKMIVKWYNELENKYPDIHCHEMVVMPNHFHCIVEIRDTNPQDAHVGAPLRGRPNDPINDPDHDPINNPVHDPINDPVHDPINETKYGPDNKKFGATIGDVVDWFKTMTTNEYIRGVKNQGWKRFDGKLWQRNYWEHIIRDDGSYDRITEYIIQNPSRWNDDQLNPDQNS